MPREIPLTQGKVAIVDSAVYADLRRFAWHAVCIKGKWYARRWSPALGRNIYMHEVVSGTLCPGNLFVGLIPAVITDHRNGDGLDNRKRNLRPATVSQNQMNSPGRVATRRSNFKGVSRGSGRNADKWRAAIKVEGKSRHLGYYAGDADGERQAAEAYDAAARQYFGQFAWTNFDMQQVAPA
jgi:hypothetical protein